MILCAVFPFSHCISRLIVTCGGIETSRCTWSFDTCPFIIFTSCPQADFPDQVPHSRRSLSYHRLPVLGRPYQVEVNLVYHVRAASVFSHPSSLLAALLGQALA
jgi:hypothetical protein